VLFWLLLLALKHPDWGFVWQSLLRGLNTPASIAIPVWLIIDWISLTKARYLLYLMSTKHASLSVIIFFLLDVVASYLILLIVLVTVSGLSYITNPRSPDILWNAIKLYLQLTPIIDYITRPSNTVSFFGVLSPSTLLTSAWTLLLVLTFFVAKLLVPLEQLRRFTAFWFRDVEKHPLTSIAKVAATLIIAGATVIKVIRWV
jgi:hypothetical protein